MAKSKTRTPIFPCGIEYDTMPAGARQSKALWKKPQTRVRFPDGRIAELPAEAIEVDLECAIETEANMRLVAILQSGKIPTAQDFERCATKPPMSGQRLFDLLQRLGDQSEQYARKAVQAHPRIMGSNGGKAPRKDRYAQQKTEVLRAWAARSNPREDALPWAERMHNQRAIRVKPRTAAGWIRKAEPKKKQRLAGAAD